MNKNKSIKKILLSTVLFAAAALSVTFIRSDFLWYTVIAGYGATLLLWLGSILTAAYKKERGYKILTVLTVIWLLALVAVIAITKLDLVALLSSAENIKKIILSSGKWGIAICLLIQIAQVVVLPVPATIFYIAFSAVYGLIGGFLISYIGTLIGSVIAFSIGKLFGKKAAEWCFGKDKVEKYSDVLNKKGKVPFILMQLLPFFPDDILCMVAGLSTMSYKYFTIVMVLVKPIYIFLVCLMGTGDSMPKGGWGVALYVIIFGGFLLVSFLYFKYQDKIDGYFKGKFSKKDQ